MYTVAEAAEIAKISAIKADEIINAKGIPTENFGGKRFISKENVSLLKIKKQKYYKVFVFNEKIFGYVVKNARLLKVKQKNLLMNTIQRELKQGILNIKYGKNCIAVGLQIF